MSNSLTIELLDRIQMVRGEDDVSVSHECEKAKAIIHREAAKERQRLDALMSAAKSVIERWDSPSWKDLPATADYIHKLRNAVAIMGDASTDAPKSGGKVATVSPTNSPSEYSGVENNSK